MTRVGLLLFALCALSQPRLGAQATGAFIVRLGDDTMFVEQYTRSRDRLQGDQISRVANRTTVRHFVATLDAQGNVVSYELVGRPAAEPGARPQRAAVTFLRDTATVRWTIGDSSRTARVAVRAGTIPYVGFSYALIELLTARARGVGVEPETFEVLPLGAGPSFATTIQRVTADTVVITFGEGGPVRVRVDSTGRVLGASAVGTTEQITVDRVPWVDVPALEARFAGRPLGLLSPRDSVRATVGRATISINYGRPSMRGRQIFGNVVPWNEVWRTGANAATGFTTSTDLVMGGKTIPAGSYTLWTIPGPRSWTLILNTQTGQWGTAYDPSRDLVRVDMNVVLMAEPVERLTIAVEPRDQGGILKVVWETTEASIPLIPR
jgi:hypothetical protein